MSATPRPHDLVWLNHASALEDIAEPWVAQQWRAALPVVVRRDVDDQARVPVGVRGMKREQRAAGWYRRAISCAASPRRCLLIVRSYSIRLLSRSRRSRGLSPSPYTAGPGAGASPAVPATRCNRDPGAACGQRSGSADPRATAAGPRGAAGMADPGGPTSMPR